MTIKVKLVSGYVGKYGNFVATRIIEMPFAPWDGLAVDTSLGDIGIDDNEMCYDSEAMTLTAHTTDFEDYYFNETDGYSLDALRQTMELHGWELDPTSIERLNDTRSNQ